MPGYNDPHGDEHLIDEEKQQKQEDWEQFKEDQRTEEMQQHKHFPDEDYE